MALEEKRVKLMTAAMAAKRAKRDLGNALGKAINLRDETNFAECSIM